MTHHATITPERWATFSLATQLINISSELSRAISFERRKDVEREATSLERVRELLDLSVAVGNTPGRRRELARLREVMNAIIVGDADFAITLADIQAELEPFALICAKERSV